MSVIYYRNREGKFIEVPALVGKSAYDYAVAGGYRGTQSEFENMLARYEQKPLNFTGHVQATYDGNTEMNVPIPSDLDLIYDVEFNDAVRKITVSTDMNGEPFALKYMKIIIYIPKDSDSGYAVYELNNTGGAYVNPSSNWTGGTLEFNVIPCTDYALVNVLKYGSGWPGQSSTTFLHNTRWDAAGKFKTITSFNFEIFNREMQVGTTLKIYGIRDYTE